MSHQKKKTTGSTKIVILVLFIAISVGSHQTLVKGVPIANSVSAFRDETLTIRLATLQNPEISGRKYPATHLGEIEANLPFLDRC